MRTSSAMRGSWRELPFGMRDERTFRYDWRRFRRRLTSRASVVIISNMKAVELVRTRLVYSERAFAELVLWELPRPLPGSPHRFRYRLAYVVDRRCVLRYDNESGKGDHRHVGKVESSYEFSTPEKLIADFEQDIARWNDEDRDT